MLNNDFSATIAGEINSDSKGITGQLAGTVMSKPFQFDWMSNSVGVTLDATVAGNDRQVKKNAKPVMRASVWLI